MSFVFVVDINKKEACDNRRLYAQTLWMFSAHIGRWSYLPFVIVVPFLVLLVSGSQHISGNAYRVITNVSISFSAPQMVSHTDIGATHTEFDADADQSSVQAFLSAKRLMQTALLYQNQHIMGWGDVDPEPEPGVYDWSRLDARVQLMRSTHARMVLTLCCAPGWMRPQGYQNDWRYLEIAPDAAHVEDFADLARKVALRYPDVIYFQVWNELKGMWSTSPGATPGIGSLRRWDYERYTTLYNAVYTAIKRVRPAAWVGGPYISMVSDGNKNNLASAGPSYTWGTLDQEALDVLSYWLVHKDGADFITVDGGSANEDGVWRTDAFDAAQKFADVYNWIRAQPGDAAKLPIWWAEWYANDPGHQRKSLDYYNALMTYDQIVTLKSRASVMLLWGPQGDASGYSFPESIWTATGTSFGGQATPYYVTEYAFAHYFAAGTPLYAVTTSNPRVAVLASSIATLLVNRLPYSQEVIVNHIAFGLRSYQVLLVKTP
jgi:hypothetical protein